MRRTFKYLKLTMVLALIAGIYSCTKDVTEPTPPTLSEATLVLGRTGEDLKTVTVESASEWAVKAAEGSDWLTVEKVGEFTFTVKATLNETMESRESKVIVTNNSEKTSEIVVTQLGSNLGLDETSIEFDSNILTPIIVTVIAVEEWTATKKEEDSWFSFTKEEKELTVIATPNYGKEARESAIIVKSGSEEVTLIVKQRAGDSDFVFLQVEDVTESVVSLSGEYLVSFIDAGSSAKTPIKYNVFTNTRTELTNIPSGKWEGGIPIVDAVANDGSIFYHKTAVSYCIDKDGVSNAIKFPATCAKGNVTDISNDASIWVGFGVSNESPRSEVKIPIVWINGVPKDLPMFPMTVNGARSVNGMDVLGCSDDGSVIYGIEVDTDAAVYWTAKDGKYKVNYVAKEIIKKSDTVPIVPDPDDPGPIPGDPLPEIIPYYYSVPSVKGANCISSNGRFIAFTYIEKLEGGNKEFCGSFNILTNDIVLHGLVKHSSTAVTNEGDVIVVNTDNNDGYVLPAGGNENTILIPTKDWVNSRYSYELKNGGSISRVSGNGDLFGTYTVKEIPEGGSVEEDVVKNWFLCNKK